MTDRPTYCFIGAGSMTEALLSGLLEPGDVDGGENHHHESPKS